MPISIRYFFRLLAAFLSRFKVLIGLGICLGIIFFLILSFIIPKISGWETIRIGMSGRFTVSNLPNDILEMIGDGLTSLDASGDVIPNIASSWNTTDKGKTWMFKIKPGLTWQDGHAVISRDIAYHFSDATVSYPDNQTISFSVQNPYSAFPSVVSKPVFKSGLMGTGKWKVKDLNLVGDFVDKLTLENDQKQSVIYKIYPTEERLKLSFELGEVDSVRGLFDANPISKWPKVKISKDTNTGEYVAMFFNMGDKTVGDKIVRQALSYATIKTNLGGVRAISPIPDNSWAYNPQVKQYTFDPAKAKSMLDILPAEIKDNLNITLTTSPLLLPQAELIQKDWQAIGVKTNVQVMSNVPNNYQALLAIFDAPDDPDQYSVWHSTQTQTNITHYSNPRIDKLLEDGRTTINTSDRRQIYLDFQRFLVEDAPAIFLFYPTTYTISR